MNHMQFENWLLEFVFKNNKVHYKNYNIANSIYENNLILKD
jgi:hypothetical protein